MPYDDYVERKKQRQLNYLDDNATTFRSGFIIHISPYAKPDGVSSRKTKEPEFKPKAILIKKHKTTKKKITTSNFGEKNKILNEINNLVSFIRKNKKMTFSKEEQRLFLTTVIQLKNRISKSETLSKEDKKGLLEKADLLFKDVLLVKVIDSEKNKSS